VAVEVVIPKADRTFEESNEMENTIEETTEPISKVSNSTHATRLDATFQGSLKYP